jgi:glucokinase
MIVLAGDVGGTNARLALVELDHAGAKVGRTAIYPSRDYPGLAPIVAKFLAETGARPERACYGIAGPVVDQRVHTSNLSWIIDGAALGRETGIGPTLLINDFAAVGWGVGRLGTQDLVTLQAGEPQPNGPIGLLGAGTGLGTGFLLWDKGSYGVHASEGAHAAFAARDELEWGLVKFLAKQFGRVSWERVVAGPGFVHLYQYLAAAGFAPEQPAVRAEMEKADAAAVVTRHGLAGTDAICVKALDMFVSAYGAQAGHLAVTIVATGGIYLAGGIAPKIITKLEDGTFMRSFRALGRFEEFATRVPVKVIMNPDVGLLGAAAAAYQTTM